MAENRKYASNLKEFKYCGNHYVTFEESEYIPPFSIEKTEGKHSLESCDNCKQLYIRFIKDFQDYKDFPNCCEPHKKLPLLKEFELYHFANFPKEMANKIIFSHHHIINNIENDNWQTEIFDYIDYVVESFGAMPEGFGSPYQLHTYTTILIDISYKVKDVVLKTINKQEYKRRMDLIFKKLESIFAPNDDVYKAIGLLLKTYEDWYNLFPFELEYFKHLEKKFQNVLPLHQNPTFNKYLKKEKKQYHTLESLSSELIQITKQILVTINAKVLFDKGELANTKQIKMDLVLKNRELELESMKDMPHQNKLEYIKILKKWMKQEKSFIKDITPYLKLQESKVEDATKKANIPQLVLFYYYRHESKELPRFDKHSKGVLKAIEELIVNDSIDTSAKYFQLQYNKIANYKSNRIANNKIKAIEFVANTLLIDFPKAQKIALEELKEITSKNR